MNAATDSGWTFRPDIEGLRSICVVAVVVFHGFPSVLPGGFAGVDAFFVISGFLITGLLLVELQRTGTVHIGQFWTRRARRILPAATLVLLAVLALACVVPAADSRDIAKRVLSAALFVFNWRRAADANDYLAGDDERDPVLHFWSLGVEEQFYVVWPLMIVLLALLARKLNARPLSLLLIAVGLCWLISFAANLALVVSDPALAYFGTYTRVWQLATGAAVAILMQHITFPVRWSAPMMLVGLAVLCASFLMLHSEIGYPGTAALAPTLATAALIVAGGAGGRTVVASTLASSPLRYVGRISYSWYLWHWPILVFGRLVFEDGTATTLMLIVLSFALASATYHFIELPVRQSQWLALSEPRTTSFAVLALALSAGAAGAVRYYGPDWVPIGNGQYVSGEAVKFDRPVIYEDGCLLRFRHTKWHECSFANLSSQQTVVLLGDSHAAHWFPALETAATSAGWRLLVRAKAGCRPSLAKSRHSDGRPYPECETWRQDVVSEMATLRPNMIVMAGMGVSLSLPDDLAFFTRLAASTQTAVSIIDTPVLPQSPVDCLRKKTDPGACTWRSDALNTPKADSIPQNANLPGNARFLYFNDLVCPGGQCNAVLDGHVPMTDRHHLTASFSRRLAPRFKDLLDEIPAR